MGFIRKRYHSLPARVRKWLEISGLIIGLFIYTILINWARDRSPSALFLILALTFLGLGLGPLRRWNDKRLAKRGVQARIERVKTILGTKTWEEGLAEAPHEYTRWPDGDNNYLICTKESNGLDGYVTTASGPEEAELWILEQMLRDQKVEPTDNK